MRRTAIGLVMVIGLLVSCKENSEVDLGPNVNSANIIVLARNNHSFIFGLLEKAERDTILASTGVSQIDSAEVTRDSTLHTTSFLFQNKRCPDTLFRTGLIRATYHGPLFQEGSAVIIEYIGYLVDVDTYSGTDTIVNTGIDQQGRWVLKSSLRGGRILRGVGGAMATYEMQSLLLVDSADFREQGAFQWSMSGSITGTSDYGDVFSGESTDPMVADEGCPYILTGKISMTVPAAAVMTGMIDYLDDGACNPNTRYDFDGRTILNERLKHHRP